jgi:hypothetical protein
VEQFPEIVVEIKLGSPHDVYYSPPGKSGIPILGLDIKIVFI